MTQRSEFTDRTVAFTERVSKLKQKFVDAQAAWVKAAKLADLKFDVTMDSHKIAIALSKAYSQVSFQMKLTQGRFEIGQIEPILPEVFQRDAMLNRDLSTVEGLEGLLGRDETPWPTPQEIRGFIKGFDAGITEKAQAEKASLARLYPLPGGHMGYDPYASRY